MKKKLKILHITNLLPHYRIPVYKLLSEHHDVVFLFHSDGSEFYIDRNYNLQTNIFKGEYLKGYTVLPKFRITPKLVWYLLFSEYDILLLSLVGRFSVPVSFFIARYIKRKPIIGWLGMWSHPQTFFHRITFPITKAFYKSLDAILVYGVHSKKYLETLGVKAEKIFCAWNAVDNSLFDREVLENEREEIRNLINVAKDERFILYVGRLTESKGVQYLLEAFEILQKNGDWKTKLIIVGRGPKKLELENQIKTKNIQNVNFVEYIENSKLAALYSIATCLVLPSVTTKQEKEPWGLVCNEAMIQGCPVIASNAVGAAMGGLIQHNVNGIVFPERNASELAQKILELFCNSDFARELSENAKKTMKQWTPEYQFSGIEQAVNLFKEQK